MDGLLYDILEGFLSWLLFLYLIRFYTDRHKNPNKSSLRACLEFTVFLAAGFGVMLLIYMLLLGSQHLTEANKLPFIGFATVLIIMPFYRLAMWQIKKPPKSDLHKKNNKHK